jgi:hypothetical protein
VLESEPPGRARDGGRHATRSVLLEGAAPGGAHGVRVFSRRGEGAHLKKQVWGHVLTSFKIIFPGAGVQGGWEPPEETPPLRLHSAGPSALPIPCCFR